MARVILIEPNLLANPSLRVMPTLYKTFWLYLLTSCDHSGVWLVDWEVASIVIGGKIDQEKARKFFLEIEDGSSRPKAIEFDKGRKWFLPKFLEFQSPNGLFSNAPWAKSVRKTAEKHGICLETMMPFECKNKPFNEPLNKGLDKPYRTGQGQDTDNNSLTVLHSSIEGGMGGDNFSDDFNSRDVLYRDFIQAYGDFGRQQKRGAIEQALLEAMRKLNQIQPEATWNQCAELLIYQAKQACKTDHSNGQTKRLNPETWLNNRVYETNIDMIKQPTKLSPSQKMDAALEKFAAKILGGQND